MRAARCTLALLAALASPAAAQRPGEIAGRVVDALTGAPVHAAAVALEDDASAVSTDAAGAFLLRGLEPGAHTLRIARVGYDEAVAEVAVANGRTTRVLLRMEPRPAELQGIAVRAAGTDRGVRIERGAIEASGARTAGDVVQNVPGVVLRSTSAGGPQTASIRGSDARAVLVLIDGTVLNDPVTGVADLSAVPAATVESVTVLPGAQAARYGARAEAGTILIRTREQATGASLEAHAGSLGTHGLRVEAGGGSATHWNVGGGWSETAGAFEFELPREAGGGSARRANADAAMLHAFTAASTLVGDGVLRLRAGAEGLERGLPGRGFAPSPRAREELRRLRASAEWQRQRAESALQVSLAGVVQRVRFDDDAPPFGAAYHDTTRVSELRARVDAQRTSSLETTVVTWGGGVELRLQALETTMLDDAPAGRTDAGGFGHVEVRLPHAGGVSLSAQARLDRDPLAGNWRATHGLTAAIVRGGASLTLSHRSAYAPPALGDQFFRDAVGVEPNPLLRAERVPSEVEASLALARAIGAAAATLTLSAHHGVVRDMIVWAPDYRFVWSPRNFDVRRDGAEAALDVELPGVLRGVSAWYAYARVVYDDARDDAQLAYRPRHTAAVSVEAAASGWSGAIDARYTGIRYPAAARVNALPAFWTLSGRAARAFRAGPLRVDASLRVDRILDEKHTLIFGFPDPGRVAELRIGLSRTARGVTLLQRLDP